ncbi:MAG: PLP-dependent aspartate aminotransferase family protein [Planctomycetota bacterium]|nr:PLP-dependent aspartate aminotransferase family protein [Planctomycetota bacterium]
MKKDTQSELRFATRAIHAGQEPDASTGAVVIPIHPSSTFLFDAPGKPGAYEYSRTQNPTRAALEECIASLEGGSRAVAFSSGCAAMMAVLNLLVAGDHVVAGDQLYGGALRLFKHLIEPRGIAFEHVDTRNVGNIMAAIRPNTRMVWVETPTNPVMRIVDIQETARITKGCGVWFVVDNTFATPYFQRPLELGADIVVESSTKYFGGHSDLVGGVCAVNDARLGERLAFYQNAAGAVPSPFDCWLQLRGIKTLHVRMERHAANALKVASFLEKHPRVARVYYPGLRSSPQYATARKQMSGFGGMVSFEVRGTDRDAMRVASATKVFMLAESLGGVESLIEHAATMTHAKISKPERARGGLAETLIRLSVGIEDAADLVADLDRALGVLSKRKGKRRR